MQKVVIVFTAVLVHIAIGAELIKPESSGVPVPRIPLNLDLPPEERWGPVLKHWDLNQLKNLLQTAFHNFVPPAADPVVDLIGDSINELLPQPYAQEIRGISKTIGLSIGEITCMNLLYDFTAACTSIVAQDLNGTIWHGRNLDYAITPLLRNITTIIDFQSKNKTIYTTTSFLGQVGVFTGMKPHRFTISINERDQGRLRDNIIGLLKALVKKEIEITTFLIRDALMYDNSYEEVMQRVVPEKLVSPVYVIVGGIKPGEGAVVTRDRTYTLDVWHLDNAHGRWFLLETNYDHWTPPPPNDDRRDPGNKAMNATGQANINNVTMWNVLSTEPVLNVDTVYTALMCAAKPEVYSSKLRFLP